MIIWSGHARLAATAAEPPQSGQNFEQLIVRLVAIVLNEHAPSLVPPLRMSAHRPGAAKEVVVVRGEVLETPVLVP